MSSESQDDNPELEAIKQQLFESIEKRLERGKIKIPRCEAVVSSEDDKAFDFYVFEDDFESHGFQISGVFKYEP